MIVVEGIAVCTASWSDVVIHSVFAKVTKDRDLGISCQEFLRLIGLLKFPTTSFEARMLFFR